MKYKDLEGKAKLEYLWDYYRLPFFAILFSVIMIIWIGTTVWENKNRIIALDLTIVGDYVNPDAVLLLQESLKKAYIEKGIEGEVTVESINLSSNTNPEQQMANNAKFFAKTSSNTIDVIISFADNYKGFAETGLFAPLDEFFATGVLVAEDEAKMYSIQNESTEEKIYGVNVSVNPKLAGLMDPANGIILSICVNSEKRENAIEAMKFILE
ncbi:MAG: hypothetical protein H7X94_12335 [Vallitaleaceae bacterium]|nr:hypothetical protein [Vallitaleaceae bacterium]